MQSACAAIGIPYIPGANELRPFVADLWLVATAVAVLLTPFFVRRSNTACALVSLAGLAAAIVSLIVVGPSAGETADRFRPMLVADHVAFFWKVLLLLFTMGVILMWFATT